MSGAADARGDALLVRPRPCPWNVRGKCLRPEYENPGLRPEYQCRRLSRLAEQFDAFLDRVEAFSLSDDRALRMLSAMRRPPEPSACPLQEGRESRDAAALAAQCCPRFLDGLCLLRLPPCRPGRQGCRTHAVP